MMGAPINPKARVVLGRLGTREEMVARWGTQAEARGMSLEEYESWIIEEGRRLASEAAADPSTEDI